MKKYITFAFLRYYPSGGMADIVGSYDSLSEAMFAGIDADVTWMGEWHIVDRDTWEVVERSMDEG